MLEGKDSEKFIEIIQPLIFTHTVYHIPAHMLKRVLPAYVYSC